MTRAPAPPAPPALWVFPCPVQLTLELGPDGRLAFVSDIHLSGGGPASDFTATSALAELLTCLYDDPGQVIARARRRHARLLPLLLSGAERQALARVPEARRPALLWSACPGCGAVPSRTRLPEPNGSYRLALGQTRSGSRWQVSTLGARTPLESYYRYSPIPKPSRNTTSQRRSSSRRASSSASRSAVAATNRRDTLDFDVPDAACSTSEPTGSSQRGSGAWTVPPACARRSLRLLRHAGMVISRGLAVAELRGWTPPVAIQMPWSLADREVEHEHLPMAAAMDLAVTPWDLLEGGSLTGKYLAPPDGPSRYGAGGASERVNRIAAEVLAVAGEVGRPPAQVAINWVRQPVNKLQPIREVSVWLTSFRPCGTEFSLVGTTSCWVARVIAT